MVIKFRNLIVVLGFFLFLIMGFGFVIADDLTAPTVNLVSPLNASYTNSNITNCSITDDVAISNLSIRVWNSSGDLIYSNITALSGTNNSTFWQVNVTSGRNYTWNCLGNDSSGNSNWSTNNYTFFYDITNPTLKLNNSATINSSSRMLSLNITTNDTYFVSVNITANGIHKNSSASALKDQNLTFNVTADGVYTVNITTYDRAGNTNSTTINWTSEVDSPLLYVYSPINNSMYYINQTIVVNFSATDYLMGTKFWNNGTANVSVGNVTINFSTAGNRNFTFYGNNSFSNMTMTTIFFSINETPTTTFLINDTSYNVSANISSVVLPYNRSLSNITLENSSQEVSVDLTQLFVSSNIATIVSNVSLITIDTKNYSAIIPAGVNVTGVSGWDGKLKMPFVNTSSSLFIEPELAGYNTSDPLVVIDMGGSSEINFSSPVEVILGGMFGQRAAWSRGDLNLINIVQCTSATDHSIIDPTNVTLCYFNDANGVDLDIWTYHFTSFAAYNATLSTTTTTVSNSGSSLIGATEGYWKLTYVLSSKDFTSGAPKEYKAKERAKILINGEEHYVGVISMGSNSAVINVSSKSQQTTFNTGEEKKFDVNEDGYYDLDVVLNSIATLGGVSKASVSIKNIYEKIPVVITPAQNNSLVGQNTDSGVQIANKSNVKGILVWILLIILVVIIILAVIFIVFRKGKSSNNRYVVYRRG